MSEDLNRFAQGKAVKEAIAMKGLDGAMGINAQAQEPQGRVQLQDWIDEAEKVLLGRMVILQEAKQRVKWMGQDDCEMMLKLLNVAMGRI